jgi:2-polyprenyl-6-methoxyphenol hydroxylase-like FAD-dependent oxidoreductase
MTQDTSAIIIGGSMAGLLAARVLSEHFDRVTILERDRLPDGPDFRNGAPQARHLHALLGRGQQIMEELFPGLADDFQRIGAPRYEWGPDTAYLTAGGWLKRFSFGYITNLVSRTALEYLIRTHLLERGNVEIITEMDVQGLATTDDRATVIGVDAASRGEKGDGAARALRADLVVDASGRNSKTPEWFRALGYDTPPESTVYAHIGYATRWYDMPVGKYDWKVLFISGRPAEGITRGGAIFEMEGNRWVATLGGLNRDYPPTDDDGFLAYAAKLASPTVAEALKDAKPISPIYGYRIDGNRLRHYEKLKRLPENYVIVGDALCSFNPIYGQGMTVAALQALALVKALAGRDRSNLAGFAAAFQAQAAHMLRDPWLLATGEDMRYPGTEGQKPDMVSRFMQRYVDQVLRTLPDDEVLTRAFIEVSNLTRPPTALLTPQMFLRVARHSLGSWGSSTDSRMVVPPRPAVART